MVSENLYAVGHNTGVGGRVAGEETFPWKTAFQEKGKGTYFRAIPTSAVGANSNRAVLPRDSAKGLGFGAVLWRAI